MSRNVPNCFELSERLCYLATDLALSIVVLVLQAGHILAQFHCFRRQVVSEKFIEVSLLDRLLKPIYIDVILSDLSEALILLLFLLDRFESLLGTEGILFRTCLVLSCHLAWSLKSVSSELGHLLPSEEILGRDATLDFLRDVGFLFKD